MAETKVTEKLIEHLVPDDRNFNKGTEYGDRLLEESLHRFGLGRSILLDRFDRIIAGNKTAEKAVDLGFRKCVVVETDGETLVAVKRTDIELDTKEGREMALADNATGKENLSFDNGLVFETADTFGFSPEDWGFSAEGASDGKAGAGKKGKLFARMTVESDDLSALNLLFNELQERGFVCKLK